MNQSKGDKGDGNFKPQEQDKEPRDVICSYCGQKFLLNYPYILPKHKNPLNGKTPDKGSFCIGEGKIAKTVAEIKQKGTEMKKEEKRQRARERRQQLREL